MKSKDNHSDRVAKLRVLAEKKLWQKSIPLPGDLKDLTPEKIHHLFHELEVHQIELEMANDELLSAQEELNASRKLYFDLYDLAPVGYCVVNEKGLILKANLTAATLLGQGRAELINTPLSRLILKKDQDTWYTKQKILFKTLQPQKFELQMVRTASQPFWARLDTSIAQIMEEKSVCQITLTDISESKRTEQTLKERIKELNFFYDLSDLLEMPGISLNELLYRTVLLIPSAWQFPEIAEARIEIDGQIYQTKNFKKTKWVQTNNIIIQGKTAGQVTVTYLEELPTSDAGPFLFEEIRLLKAIAGRLGYIVERIQMTEKVQHSEKFLQTAIGAITNPFAVINASDYTIEIANDVYGGPAAVGLKCHAFSHKRDSPCTGEDYRCPVLEVRQTGQPFVGEHVHCDEQGGVSYLETYAYPVLDKNRQVLQVIEYQIDITARRQAELALKKKAAELEEMNTALKVLLNRRDQDQKEIEEKIFASYQLLLSPIIRNLEKTLTQENQQEMINILESELKNILSPFSKNVSDKMINLTPTEIHVANLIKLGKSNKEISDILICSIHTIARHRDSIRKKTGLKNKKINLRSFLLSLQ